MSRYAHLIIFQKAYDLTLRFFRETHEFPREHKFSLGQQMKDACLAMLDAIIEANAAVDKKPALERASACLERLRVYTRLAYDLKVIGMKKYEVLSKHSDEIGRMIGGWMKS
ncbi:MAG: diversity-generating retroelement protein Avd [Candidatus Peribacteraceae bacterium]|nr:diversity-generating retroelement protein Avd [Candidatus Peribacteraceae bacterium]MDD5742835.1 diversity-generating retroelement protein Avd [Candidatus Peribacteraceae bacterium]